MRPTFAEINLHNLRKNFSYLRSLAPNSKFMAVVKADGYGHGAVEVSKSLLNFENPPEYFAVALLEEAVELRKSGIEIPILVFDPLNEKNIDDIIKYNIMATVNDESQIALLKKYETRHLKVHMKIDTGMGRVGIEPKKAGVFLKSLLGLQIEVEGLYTHFASADSDAQFTQRQIKLFKKFISEFEKEKIRPKIIHASNSAAILHHPEAHFNCVRPGLALYGFTPDIKDPLAKKLLPVMQIKSYVSTVRFFEKGESVSYGRKYILKSKSKIISVPIGYADGINRSLTNKMECIIGEKKYQQVGTVTMDRIMFDVGKDDIQPGDEVIIIGAKGNNEITAWHLAKKLKTIPYEITCCITKRVPRIYIS